MGMRKKEIKHTCEVAVVGGGMTGICAAIASARGGADTILIQDRPVLGGTASSEIRMHICGASANRTKENAEETGILHEIFLDNKACNDYYNYSIWDNVLMQKVYSQKNLKLLLNTSMQNVELEDSKITSVDCYQLTTETNIHVTAKIFVDCTGNGTLSYFAGAKYMTGEEPQKEFDEPDAPEKANQNRMGNTILFKAVDRGGPVKFKTPDWAKHFTEDDLKYRRHVNDSPDVLAADDLEKAGCEAMDCPGDEAGSFFSFGIDYGYWWIELSGESEDYVSDYEDIRDRLVQYLYGVWDHIKNGGDHGADSYDLQWVGMLPGVREGRRVLGDYILTENDILENRIFEDAVAYGGWPIDIHAPHGLDDKDIMPSFVRWFPGFYTIPYRCYCNKDFENLFQAGRVISATKLAMASTRVMGTCAVGGQAVGTAAAMCVSDKCLPRDIGGKIEKLQQRLLRDDCYIPGFTNRDSRDIAMTADVYASSRAENTDPKVVVNGVSRNEKDNINCWESDGIAEGGETLTLKLKEPGKIAQVRLTFDSNLSRPSKITLSAKRMAEQQIGVPIELVKNYHVTLFLEGKRVGRQTVEDNHQRLNVLHFENRPLCDEVAICITETNGYPNARIFEIRVYDSQE